MFEGYCPYLIIIVVWDWIGLDCWEVRKKDCSGIFRGLLMMVEGEG